MPFLLISDMAEQNNNVRKAYAKLCTVAVFRGVLELPLFSRFLEYAAENGEKTQKMLKYAAFVAQIYCGGGDLTDCVRRAVFEYIEIELGSILRRANICHLISTSSLITHPL